MKFRIEETGKKFEIELKLWNTHESALGWTPCSPLHHYDFTYDDYPRDEDGYIIISQEDAENILEFWRDQCIIANTIGERGEHIDLDDELINDYGARYYLEIVDDKHPDGEYWQNASDEEIKKFIQ